MRKNKSTAQRETIGQHSGKENWTLYKMTKKKNKERKELAGKKITTQHFKRRVNKRTILEKKRQRASFEL